MMADGITPENLQEWHMLVCKFRGMMGSRRVMQAEGSRSAVLKGFAVAYMRMELPADQQARAEFEFQSNVAEFVQRCIMMDLDH